MFNTEYVNRGKRNSWENRYLLVDHFQPRSYQEERILDIARSVGENSVAFLRSKLQCHPNGFAAIEAAYGELQDVVRSGEPIRNPAALLNHLVLKQLNMSKPHDHKEDR